MANGGKLQRCPSALEMVLRRLSIVDGHALGCQCPRCTRSGDVANPYSARAEVVRAELVELEHEREVA